MTPNGRFTSLSDFVHLDQIISGEKFLKKSGPGFDFNYLKRDFFYRKGVWRDENVKSLIFNSKFYKSKPLVLGHSDIPTKIIEAFVSKNLGIPKLFAVNHQFLDGYSESIPLGITNNCDDSPIHKILSDESHFIMANNVAFSNDFFNPSIYVNFTPGNNRGLRNRVLSVAGQITHSYKIVIRNPDFTASGRINYLRDLRTHGLVLCPEGNGVETHRFWETIYMGGVPVVTKNPIMHSFYSTLPVIQLDSWTDLVDRSLIEERWWEITNKNYDFAILSSRYWIEKFSTL